MTDFKKNNQKELTISVVLVSGIIVLLNFFAWRFSQRYDLTENKSFSISSYSKQQVKGLPDVVTVKAYFSKDLPPQFAVVRQQVSDLLNEYAGYGGNFRVKYIDPGDGKEAEAAGIPKLQFNDVRRDKLEVSGGYFGLTITYQGKSEILPMVNDVSVLEYQLTSTLKKLTAAQLPEVGWLSGFGEAIDGYDLARASLAKVYKVKSVSLKNKTDLTAASTLLIADPTKQFSKADGKALDDYLNEGKTIIVLYDKIRITEGLVSAPNESNLPDWLASHGLKLGDVFVLDSVSGAASFNQGYLSYSLSYPYWPKLSQSNFNSQRAIFARLEGVILPWVTAIDPAISSSTQVLASTGPKAWLADRNATLSPEGLLMPTKGFQRFSLAAEAVAGKGKIVLVGDADFAKDQYSGNNPANLIFFQDLVDSALQEEGLSAIRAKNVTIHPIKDLPEKTKQIIRYASVFGLSFLVVVAGALVFLSRRKTKDLKF